MGKVAIVGGGAFGTRMACVARRSGNEVALWAREPKDIGTAVAGAMKNVISIASGIAHARNVGDFMNTAHSLQSRNTTLGIAIGEGKRAADVLAGRKQVTEGASNVVGVVRLARTFKVEMPITLALDAILMASHGEKGDAISPLGSETVKAAMLGKVPVLVHHAPAGR